MCTFFRVGFVTLKKLGEVCEQGAGRLGLALLYTAAIKVLGGLVIPKEYIRWHNRHTTHGRHTYIATYGLNRPRGQFNENILIESVRAVSFVLAPKHVRH